MLDGMVSGTFSSKTDHSHAGYSESSSATGSLPVFFIFKFNGVPALHDETTVFVGVEFCSEALHWEKVLFAEAGLDSLVKFLNIWARGQNSV